MKSINEELGSTTYPGRGIIIGKTKSGKAAMVYFIMGRSENSRNRVFVEDGEGIKTKAYDESKLTDPSLIIYAPVRVLGKQTIVTNGNQTDTIYEGMSNGKTFEESLLVREFEPDAPNYTPRISGILFDEEGNYSYKLSILKRDPETGVCQRFTYDYREPVAGVGHFIHTYMQDGNPIPSFTGEPEALSIPDDIDELTNECWNSLNADNKVSLFVRLIDLDTLETETRIINKNNQ